MEENNQTFQPDGQKTENNILKKLPLPILIIVIGFALGLLICGVGLLQYKKAMNTNAARKAEAQKTSEANVAAAKARLEEIETELANLEAQLEAKTSECNTINSGMGKDPDWFTKASTCGNEKTNLSYNIGVLEQEQTSILNADYTVYYTLVAKTTYQVWYIVGGSVFGAALLGAFIIYLVKGKKTY